MIHVLIFITNIACQSEAETAGNHLAQLPGLVRWSIDLNDIDKILRVESEHNCAESIIALMQQAGYSCVELL